MQRQQDLQKIQTLANEFRCLKGKPGVSPWDAAKLDAWAVSGLATHCEFVTAKFLLAASDISEEWKCGPFNVMEALAIWDVADRHMFLRWAADPWWA